jgi:hypothetical protein
VNKRRFVPYQATVQSIRALRAPGSKRSRLILSGLGPRRRLEATQADIHTIRVEKISGAIVYAGDSSEPAHITSERRVRVMNPNSPRLKMAREYLRYLHADALNFDGCRAWVKMVFPFSFPSFTICGI